MIEISFYQKVLLRGGGGGGGEAGEIIAGGDGRRGWRHVGGRRRRQIGGGGGATCAGDSEAEPIGSKREMRGGGSRSGVVIKKQGAAVGQAGRGQAPSDEIGAARPEPAPSQAVQTERRLHGIGSRGQPDTGHQQ